VSEAHGEFYEFDREPVREDRLLGPGYFAAAYAGEHVAATEFVIGASFVSWGASIGDVFFGLAVGNLLAVASWTLLCAPIAVDTRLTLYWYLRRVGGPTLTAFANVLNALLYCVLAGAMITVSASAVRIPLGLPAQTHVVPDDWRFVALVLALGAVVTWIAVRGFRRLAAFSAACSPWMFTMFVAGALAVLPALARSAGLAGVHSWRDFWEIGGLSIWTGRTPDGSPPLTFWHVAAFAWICNAAMHAGLSDMAVLRYARRASYGLFSGFGALLGHYLAWIAAGVMGAGAAALLERPLPALDSGDVAFAALGWSGALAVAVAGWTTANPTIYRAGLALQTLTHASSRERITLAVGAATSLIACFPFVFTKLLDFVGVYGLLLSPIGAIVLTEHWLFPRLGWQRHSVLRTGQRLSSAAAGAWLGALVAGLALNRLAGVHLFFLFVPVYASAAVLYLLLARASVTRAGGGPAESPAPSPSQTRERPSPPIAARHSSLLVGVAAAALVACVGLALWMAASGAAEHGERLARAQRWLIAATLAYFGACTPLFASKAGR
jgi:NCS1 family nucleobase:cation symporter-1